MAAAGLCSIYCGQKKGSGLCSIQCGHQSGQLKNTDQNYKQNQARNRIFFLHSGCGPIWIIFGGPGTQHGELSENFVPFFFWQKKNSEFTTEISFCEFGFFFLPNQKMSYRGKKVRHVGFQVHQKSSKLARIGSGKKMLKLGTPIEISTKRQQNQAIVALVGSMLALTPVKKSTALLQTSITWADFW